ncbi:MAG TPA: BsuPI-related putative proteinase inhibitor [Saprospiraceae bacterium]|nr:BsuPI-related putative proteinase inhibitor [Saprospiraceae bacterium]HRJ15108.1 BsuPI-related putative proteinase inhibitor [Saprospiraceae bacterium]HRK82404.1 BsuPI-related putative proteinase inhibitor [Saprospiraceae bacterium]
METSEKTIVKEVPAIKTFEGYLFAKLNAIGSKSEGPSYYLQQHDGKEIPVVKRVAPWMKYPLLHACVGQKVALLGKMTKVAVAEKSGIHCGYVLNLVEPLVMGLDIDLKEDTLWINKMPGPAMEYPPQMKSIKIKLSVTWPFRSIWHGECPSSQLFDFGIENPEGKTIWRWGQCMMFKPEPTKVQIPGASPKSVTAPWQYFEDAITVEGLYVAKAEFIASGQVIRKPFWVKFPQ